jgi:hypothetical protein
MRTASVGHGKAEPGTAGHHFPSMQELCSRQGIATKAAGASEATHAEWQLGDTRRCEEFEDWFGVVAMLGLDA